MDKLFGSDAHFSLRYGQNEKCPILLYGVLYSMYCIHVLRAVRMYCTYFAVQYSIAWFLKQIIHGEKGGEKK